MSKTKPATVTGERVKSYVERVEKLIEERQAIQSDIRDVFAEAKGAGYDVKTLRKLVQLRAIDQADRDEAAALLDTYAHAIGMEVGSLPRELSEDELVEQASRIVTEVDRCMALVGENGAPPKIEAIKELIGCSTGKASKIRGMVVDRVVAGISRTEPDDRENENETAAEEVAGPAEGIGHNSKRACILPQPDAWKEITLARNAADAAAAAEAARIAAEKEAARECKRREREEERERNRRIDADTLDLPDYLRRVPA
jgi:uncharacterized protein (UPF0335 family)